MHAYPEALWNLGSYFLIELWINSENQLYLFVPVRILSTRYLQYKTTEKKMMKNFWKLKAKRIMKRGKNFLEAFMDWGFSFSEKL